MQVMWIFIIFRSKMLPRLVLASHTTKFHKQILEMLNYYYFILIQIPAIIHSLFVVQTAVWGESDLV